jgi:RNA 2',3'-cyclic 3'-phosphodiesterase
MRTFIAIELPQDIKDAISRLQSKLKATGADVKWVSPSNIHLTLKFLGEIDEKTRDATIEVMQEIASDISTFSIKLGSIGAFPGIRSPRVIWIGLSQGHDQVKTIAQMLENELEACGLAKENREFSSHITIGRIRSLKNKDALAAGISKLGGPVTENPGEFLAGKITLFKSTLTPQGPIYEKLQETNLKTT